MFTFSKKRLIIVVSVIGIIVLAAITTFLIINSNLNSRLKNENSPNDETSSLNQDDANNSDNSNGSVAPVTIPPEQQPIDTERNLEEKQFQLAVPAGWSIERDECSGEGCSNLKLRKNGYIIRISTNALFTGVGFPGDPFIGACSTNYSTVVPINTKIGRIDVTAKSDCVSEIIPGVSTPEVTDVWIGSTIVSRSENLDFDPSDIMFSISPSLFKKDIFDNDENGNYIVVTFHYEANLPSSELPSQNQKPIRLDSPELQAMLAEMDEILKTFYINPDL